MDWKKRLSDLELNKQWDEAIIFMEKIIQENPNDIDAYICMNFLLMNLLIKEDYNRSKRDYYMTLTKKYFDESYKKFSENIEYLFFTGMTAFMSEWFFEIELDEARKMLEKARLAEPENLLYEWGFYPTKERKLNISKKILLNINN